MIDTVVVLSGGLDSTVALWKELFKASINGCSVAAVTVDYGQRHHREIDSARAIVSHWEQESISRREHGRPAASLTHTVINAEGLGAALPGSALTDQTIQVPHGHYAAPSMASTVVPNRNMIISSIAGGVATAHGARRLVLGVHAGDHPIYPDCRPEFIEALQTCIRVGTGTALQVVAPFLNLTKDKIVKTGAAFLAPMELTWSCYQGGERHCGRCGTCVERREAFTLAEINDPTEYEE